MRKLVISSVAQVAKLLQDHPQLLAISGLSVLKSLSAQLNNPKSKCSKCQAAIRNNPYAAARPHVESALANLSKQDYLDIKAILGMDEICFFHKVDGKLTQTCLK